MKSLLGVYDTHEKAIKAIKLLKKEEFPMANISLLGQTRLDEEDIPDEQIDENHPSQEAPLVAGAVLGPVLGVLTGIGVFAIPGLGFLYGAGAMIGALAGFDFGLVGGGIVSLLTTIGIDKKHHVKFKEYIKNGKVILIAKGEEEDLKMAQNILEEYGEHIDLIQQ